MTETPKDPGKQTRVFDGGNGVKVVVTEPDPAAIEAQWRADIKKEIQTIRSRLGWILFFIAAVIVVQLLSGLFRGLP